MLGYALHVMMTADYFEQFRAEMPPFRQHSATLAMGESQNLHLGFVERDTLRARDFVSFSKLLGQGPQVHHDAYVMKQSGQVGLFSVRKADLVGKAPTYQSTSHGMLPKRHWVDVVFLSWPEPQQATRHGDLAHTTKTERNHGAANRVDLLPSPKERGIGEVQALRGKRLVLRDKIRNFLYVE